MLPQAVLDNVKAVLYNVNMKRSLSSTLSNRSISVQYQTSIKCTLSNRSTSVQLLEPLDYRIDGHS